MVAPDTDTAPDEHLDTGVRARVGRVYWGYWLVGAAFLASWITTAAQNSVYGAFSRPMTQELHWAQSEFFFSRFIGQFVLAFTGLFIGTYVDRHGGRRLMTIGTLVMVTAIFLCSFVTQLWQWWLLNGLILTAGAAMSGTLVVNVTLSKWFVERRARVAGIASMGVSFAGALMPPVATLLIEVDGWRTAWRLLAIGALVIALPLTLLMRRTPEDYGLHPDGKTNAQVAAGGGRAATHDFETSLTRAQAIRTLSFYLIVVGFGCGTLSIGIMILQTIPYLTSAGYSGTFAAAMITVSSIPSMLTKPFWGWLGDRADPTRSAMLGFVTNAIALVLIVYAVRAHADWWVVVGFFLLGMGWGGLVPLQETVWASFFGRRYLGAVRSAGLPFALFIGASAPFLVSFYYDRTNSYDGAFLLVAALAVVATGLLLFAKKPEARRTLSEG